MRRDEHAYRDDRSLGDPEKVWDQFSRSSAGNFKAWPLPVFELIGARFRNGRRHAGLTQRQVAAVAGISQSVVSRFERGRVTHMSAERIVRLAIALGPMFPFGQCPHDHSCPWPSDPRVERNFWDMLNAR